MKYFEKCKTLNELKAEYRRLAMENHPDRGGDTETMQKINAAYADAFEILKAAHNRRAAEDTSGKVYATKEQAHDFIDIIAKLIKLDGIKIELCGRWLWISGETMKHKDALKSAGCKWASQKKMWSWHFAEDSVWKKGKTMSMQYIRSKYGSSIIAAEEQEERKAIKARA